MNDSDFPWHKLITNRDANGGINFEEIAFEYVVDEFPGYAWERTAQTHDGNRDAFAVITAFSATNSIEEMWMEAKYSKKNIRMSRHTIDKTIVSALVSGNVHKIVFVTNMQISEKTKKEVIRALSVDGLNYQIFFRTKYDLEVWLTQEENGRKVFQKFFDGLDVSEYMVNNFKVLGNLSFFENEMNDYLYAEPVNTLEVNKTYSVYAKIYSPRETRLSIRPSNNQKLTITYDETGINQGINTVKFRLRITSNVQSNFSILFSDSIVNEEYTELIQVKEAPSYTIRTQSQDKVLADLFSSFSNYENGNNTQYFCIAGHEGVGKSYLLRKFIESEKLRHQYVIYYEFGYNSDENNIFLIELYLKLFYVSASINSIKSSDIFSKPCRDAVSLIKKGNRRGVSKWMQNTIFQDLLPSSYCNNRIILLDNTELLTEAQTIFLRNLLMSLESTRSHSFLLVSGKSPFMQNQIHWLKFTNEDIANNIKSNQLDVQTSLLHFLADAINNVSAFSFFMDLYKRDQEHKDLPYRMSREKIGTIVSKEIEKYLLEIKDQNELTDLLKLVYILRSGFPYDMLMDEDRQSMSKLIVNNLVVMGNNGYESINSLFCEYFRNMIVEFDEKSSVLTRYSRLLSQLPDEMLRIKLSGSKWPEYLVCVNRRTDSLMKEYDYQTIVYLLTPLFSEFSGKQHKGQIWHELQFKYIYSKANIDPLFHIVDKFLSFSDELQNSNNATDMCLRIRALSEVCCFKFEEADIQGSLDTAEKVSELASYYSDKSDGIKSALNLCDATRILSLSAMDKIEEAEAQLKIVKRKWSNRDYAVTLLRFARYLLHIDTKKAKKLFEESLPVLSACKDWKWKPSCVFLLAFIDYLSGNKNAVRSQLMMIRNEFHQYASLHRSNFRLIAALELVDHDISTTWENSFCERWDEYKLLSEARFKKEKGQDNLVEGAYAFLKADYETMRTKLIAAQDIFEQFGDSYKVIINHNLSLSEKIENRRVEICTSYPILDKDCYYLDPRFW